MGPKIRTPRPKPGREPDCLPLTEEGKRLGKRSKKVGPASTCQVLEWPRGISRRGSYRTFRRRKKVNLAGACTCWGAGQCRTCRGFIGYYQAALRLPDGRQ